MPNGFNGWCGYKTYTDVAVDLGDWLCFLYHVMSDLSASSAEWWRVVLRDAQESYESTSLPINSKGWQ